jgi:hypothetical protein
MKNSNKKNRSQEEHEEEFKLRAIWYFATQMLGHKEFTIAGNMRNRTIVVRNDFFYSINFVGKKIFFNRNRLKSENNAIFVVEDIFELNKSKDYAECKTHFDQLEKYPIYKLRLLMEDKLYLNDRSMIKEENSYVLFGNSHPKFYFDKEYAQGICDKIKQQLSIDCEVTP